VANYAGRHHYWQWADLPQQLAAHCQSDPVTGCLIWNGRTDKDGYPKLMIEGRYWRGSRALLYAVTGQLGPMALHSCHRPPCLERTHLRWGTGSDNARDMWAAGRASPQSDAVTWGG
jgi:hypothetical protein